MCQRCLLLASLTTSKPTKQPAATQHTAYAQLLMLSEKRRTTKIPMNIPKGAPITAAAALADIIERDLACDDQSLERLTRFATAALSTSTSSNPLSHQSFTPAMKTNVGQFANRLTSIDDRAVLPKDTNRPFQKDCQFKLLFGDVTADVRIIAFNDSVITPIAEVVTALRLRHPPFPLGLRPPPTEPISQTLSFSEKEVMVDLKAFRPSSVGGVYGLRPGHFMIWTLRKQPR